MSLLQKMYWKFRISYDTIAKLLEFRAYANSVGSFSYSGKAFVVPVYKSIFSGIKMIARKECAVRRKESSYFATPRAKKELERRKKEWV